MSVNRRRAVAVLGALCAALAGSTASFAAPKSITIGYQTGVDPAKVAQAGGVYEKALGLAIDWRKFDSGADVITAIASGDVQIGYVGSSPLAAAASRKLPIETTYVAALLGEAEALVVRNGSGIREPKDLVGKKVGGPDRPHQRQPDHVGRHLLQA